jgi:hypothetical protein
MKFLDCPVKYIGQNGRRFHIRYKEHRESIRYTQSSHILNTGHTYGTIKDAMDIVRTQKKGKRLNTLEKYHIYKSSKK